MFPIWVTVENIFVPYVHTVSTTCAKNVMILLFTFSSPMVPVYMLLLNDDSFLLNADNIPV